MPLSRTARRTAPMPPACQEALFEVACAAWNTWATQNGQAVATDLDTRYRNAAGPACNKFARSSLRTLKTYAPNVWRDSMEKAAAQATNAYCRTACNAVKTGW
ncbi:hypothetical protein [Streptomyces sp. st115]|uniref:hypothetical protein n=1 Tax=Streptomyces sp. st115 TaxID=1828047 RepID=UPI00211D506E|nr:hypothetical protein [Streptomyces sp. st115]